MFVEFPEHLSEKEAWQFAYTQPALALHIVISIVLVVARSTVVFEKRFTSINIDLLGKCGEGMEGK